MGGCGFTHPGDIPVGGGSPSAVHRQKRCNSMRDGFADHTSAEFVQEVCGELNVGERFALIIVEGNEDDVIAFDVLAVGTVKDAILT